MKITALVPAAGMGLRLKSRLAKPLVEVQKKPILILTLEVLAAHSLIDNIVLVFNREGLLTARDFIEKHKIPKVSCVVAGGATRTESVSCGLSVIDEKTGFVVIHDGVRPFVDKSSITRVIEAAKICGAAVLGVPVKSTIKSVDGDCDVDATLERDRLWEIQTPQVFERALIQEAYQQAGGHAASDDAALVERIGKKVKVVMGSYFNIKITTPEDLVLAEAIADIRKVNIG